MYLTIETYLNNKFNFGPWFNLGCHKNQIDHDKWGNFYKSANSDNVPLLEKTFSCRSDPVLLCLVATHNASSSGSPTNIHAYLPWKDLNSGYFIHLPQHTTLLWNLNVVNRNVKLAIWNGRFKIDCFSGLWAWIYKYAPPPELLSLLCHYSILWIWTVYFKVYQLNN